MKEVILFNLILVNQNILIFLIRHNKIFKECLTTYFKKFKLLEGIFQLYVEIKIVFINSLQS